MAGKVVRAMTPITLWLRIGVLALLTLMGWGYCTERERRKRDAHDAVSDSLARDTRDADRASRQADTVARKTITEFRARWHTVRTIDTLRIPVEARDAIRSCEAAVTALETSCSRKDAVITALRVELDHARNPPPKKRLGYFAEGGYSVLDGGAVVGVGATVRLVGKVSLMGKIEGASKGSEWKERPDTRVVAGVRITF